MCTYLNKLKEMRQNVNMSKACFMPSGKKIAAVKQTKKINKGLMPQVGTLTGRETKAVKQFLLGGT